MAQDPEHESTPVDTRSSEPEGPDSDLGNEIVLLVGPGKTDVSPDGPAARASLFGVAVERIEEFTVVHIQCKLEAQDIERLAKLFVDPVEQWWVHRDDHVPEGETFTVIETGLRPGVTDREAAELRRAAGELGLQVTAASIGRRWVIHGSLSDQDRDLVAQRVLHNEVIERWSIDRLAGAYTDPSAESLETTYFDLAELDEDGLAALSATRRLGLDVVEMRAIQAWFREEGRSPSDAELEMLAQTWSEHCSHKTFRGRITTPDGVIDDLMKTYLRSVTENMNAPWVHSAFVDNAGIVSFDDDFDLALKAETHNHPSALEPFGGANTGVGGVVRDILGVSAKPIAITDILCFGPEDLPIEELPEGVLHPRRIRSGVIAGVGDYGNKIGVPNIAGAILHDDTYTTTPLVFAGCVGLLPHGSNPTNAQPGDAIVVLGGAVGRDGVGGATFSSQSMGSETAEIAGSSVQIGDPVVEKGLIDVILAARDDKLYTAVTDCGAGGLSSAVGEMAEELGAIVDLGQVPLKYPGLAPWEVWLSEAQERMVLAVPDPEPLLALARRWQVDAAVIGNFTGDGKMIVTNGDTELINLDTTFLHDGRPKAELTASALDLNRPPRQDSQFDPNEVVLNLLAHPSIRSNESVVRTYDHEVMGGTVVRPYGGVGLDAPADGTVLIPPGTSGQRALAIGIGVNVVLGRYDAGAMALNAVDEAVRNVVVAGADPKQLSLLDNFAWGNPTNPDTLAQLIAACEACRDAALLYRAPFVSGKDSLYNEFVRPDGTRDPVTPTLIITAVGIVRDLERVPITGVTGVGNQVWMVGPVHGILGGSHLDDVLGQDFGGDLPTVGEDVLDRHYHVAEAIASGLVESAHDISEGGLAVAACEWALGGRLGLELTADGIDSNEALFGEGPARYLVEVTPDNAQAFGDLVVGARKIGSVTDTASVRAGSVIDVSLEDIRRSYTSGGPL